MLREGVYFYDSVSFPFLLLALLTECFAPLHPCLYEDWKYELERDWDSKE